MKFFQINLRTSYLYGISLFGILFFLTTLGYPQTPQRPATVILPPLLVREISGIVKDSTDVGIPYAKIKLISLLDTINAGTNEDGIFVFKNVKSATYTLEIKSIGYKSLIGKYKQNDAIARVVMDPIVLKSETNTLNEVVVNGTPSITYKTDTVEYRAKDYIVRENATVDELLKKMEGMEVSTDGSLIHQGTAVTKAKINGKTYLGGEVVGFQRINCRVQN